MYFLLFYDNKQHTIFYLLCYFNSKSNKKCNFIYLYSKICKFNMYFLLFYICMLINNTILRTHVHIYYFCGRTFLRTLFQGRFEKST